MQCARLKIVGFWDEISHLGWDLSLGQRVQDILRGEVEGFEIRVWGLRTTTSQKCEAVPRRARI